MAHLLRSSSVLSICAALALLGCGGSPAATPDAGGGSDSGSSGDAGSIDSGSTEDAATVDSGGGGEDSGPRDGGVATTSPMGIDCTDTCPSFEGRDYVCTFLPGFPTTIGYCSLPCTGAGPTECVDTEPGEVYCNTDVGRCVIGCPFDACPNDMDCTFDFADQPACEPVP